MAASLNPLEVRLDRAFKSLQKDRVEETYEILPIRQLVERLEQLEYQRQNGMGDPDDLTRSTEEVTRQLERLRAEQGEAGDLCSISPKLPVILIKPTEAQKTRLEMIEKKVLAEKCAEVMEHDEPLIKAQLQEAAKTTVLLDGRTQSEGDVKAAIHTVLVTHLMRLEGATDENAEDVEETDPELEFTESELEELRISDALEGAALAEAVLTQESRKQARYQEKLAHLIANRKAEIATRKTQLERESSANLIEQIAKCEVLQRAILKARQEQTDFWLLQCVRDPAKPVTATVRGQRITQGWQPYFKTVEEVRAVRDAEGLADFYDWLVNQKNRLDFLSEGDLYALSAYAPFRGIVEPLLRLRRGDDPVSVVYGQGPD